MPRHRIVRHRRKRRINGGSFKSWMKKAFSWMKGPGFRNAKKIFNDPVTRSLITSVKPGAQKVFDRGDQVQSYANHMSNVLGSGRRRRTVNVRRKKKYRVRGASLGYGLGY